jgi:hypothetical protein
MMLVAAAALAGSVALAPRAASAEGLFDFFFGGIQKQQQRQVPSQSNFFADPFGLNQQPAPPRQVASGSGPAFCVRSCDGKYFPLMRGNASPVQMCQAFCPASVTKVFFGSTIEGASSSAGERYADSENAFAYRKALRADCTCNGRDPAGLAPAISRSTPRCGRAMWSPPPADWWPIPASGPAPAKPPNSRRWLPTRASPPMSARGSAR